MELGDESHRLIESVQRYTDQGIALPPDLGRRLGRLVAPYELADLDRHGTAEGLAGAWTAIRPRRDVERDDLVWLVLLRMFYSRFGEHVPGLKEALRSHRLRLTRTRVEIKLQLASKCYFIGSRLDRGDKGCASGLFLLEECVQVSGEVVRFEDDLDEEARSMLHGQMSVALTLLSRSAARDTVVPLLTQAQRHSSIAEQLGDTTESHFAYRGEIGLRLFDVTQDEAHLEQARDTVLAAPGMTSKRLKAVAADVVSGLGFARARSRDQAAAILLLMDADERYGQALVSAPEHEDGVDDGYLLAKRAQVRYLRYRMGDVHGRRRSRQLNDALADWLDERAEPHRHDPTVVEALLDRARARVGRNDTVGARADREQARRLLTSGISAQTDAKLRAAELDQAVADALDADDLDRLHALAREITQMPPDTPIPAAALARAGKVLVLKLPREQGRDLLSAALDRIETDLGHPSLTKPAIRHVAGHAALLAWLLARRTKPRDTHQLGRAAQLYRTAFAALEEDPPSVDALMNAGACALLLGKLFLAGDEADAEEATSLFGEALTWMSTALARVQAGSGIVRSDFSAAMVHSKVGEVALRLYPLTWDGSYLDAAIEHLGAARELGHDAIELTGLLGDAHYRRGVAQRSPEDLHQAIVLKDTAFAPGQEKRENRSLTAAAALRLSGLQHDDRLLTGAAKRALQAVQCDPTWPWPVLQLADLADHASQLDRTSLATAEPRDLAALVVSGKRTELLHRAADLAVHTQEFTGAILGGQQRTGEHGVRVLTDRHRLIEQTIVLKRLGHDDAHREHDDTGAFRAWLTDVGAPETWTLPEPLAVIDLPDGDSVYVMRRAQARLLGASLVHWRTGPGLDPRPQFREALRYLAAYQAWRAQADEQFPQVCGPHEQNTFRAQLDKIAGALGAGTELRRLLGAACEPFAAAGTPAVAKKDPHPGNWLLTRSGQLVLIDIEATSALPLLREAATVIDDLPLLETDAQGWDQRAALCHEYLDALAAFGFPVSDRDRLLERYEAMAALHAAKGLGRLRTMDAGISSFSHATAQLEADHYGALLDHLAKAATQPDVRNLAAALSAHSPGPS
ncbi:MAG TPA: hypothetical protein VLL08_26220 [Kineosporiaceae bacterium]|nr:hypothetical protein [Kineosporiaceae bacterium]